MWGGGQGEEVTMYPSAVSFNTHHNLSQRLRVRQPAGGLWFYYGGRAAAGVVQSSKTLALPET